MIRFNPPELFDRWKAALRVLQDHCDSGNWPPVLADDWDPDGWPDGEFTEDSEIEGIQPMGRTEDTFKRKVSTLLSWAEEIPSAKMHERMFLVTSKRALVHVWPVGEDSWRFFEHDVDGRRLFPVEILHGGRAFEVCLTFGLTPFAFFVGHGDKYCPVVQDTDPFVEMRFEGKPPTLDVVREIVAGFMFSVSTRFGGCAYQVTPFRDPSGYEPDDDGEDDPRDPEPPSGDAGAWDDWWQRRRDRREARRATFLVEREAARLRPVTVSAGMGDLLTLYNHGLSEERDEEYRVLCFAKVIEFVALTAVKQKAHAEIRKRLMDSRALAPDARFIEDLIQLVDAQRDYRKDAEALRLAVREFADLVTLAPLATPALASLRAFSQSSGEKDRERALDDLSAMISATRNQIVHGKANYTLTGRECPREQTGQFVRLMQTVAIQAVNWFGTVPESARVTRG